MARHASAKSRNARVTILDRMRIEVETEMVEAEAYYRHALAQPAVLPWATSKWKPITLGPSWQVTDDGHWLLPERTLGWTFLAWTSVCLRIDGERIRWTGEQARFWLWWFAVDAEGVWLYRAATFQRLKGHGKDPMAAALAIFELIGPCRVARVNPDGSVLGEQHPEPWVDVAAVTQAQTKTTMRLLPAMLPDSTRRLYRVPLPGRLSLHARGDTALLQAVTSNAAALEGNRTTLVIMQEPHHWRETNGGHDMAAVLKRNTTKSKGGSSRTIRFTNAYQPGLDSVAERDREAYDTGKLDRYLYDTLEAPRGASLDPDIAPEIVEIVKGDSWWLNSREILSAISEVETGQATEAEVRRFWYNQVEGASDAWMDYRAWAENAVEGLSLAKNDAIVVFFDGSKSQDSTALLASRVSDGAVFVLGLWQRPPGLLGTRRMAWRVSRDAVDWAMTNAYRLYDVWGIWGDPSDAMDDDGNSYWTPVLDAWHERWGPQLLLPAEPSETGHSVIWDMRTPKHQKEFVEAAQLFVDDAERLQIPHPDDKRLNRHVRNAKKRPSKFGTGLGKATRTSNRKIDLAVAAVGARMMRRQAQTLRKGKATRRGRAIGVG